MTENLRRQLDMPGWLTRLRITCGHTNCRSIYEELINLLLEEDNVEDALVAWQENMDGSGSSAGSNRFCDRVRLALQESCLTRSPTDGSKQTTFLAEAMKPWIAGNEFAAIRDAEQAGSVHVVEGLWQAKRNSQRNGAALSIGLPLFFTIPALFILSHFSHLILANPEQFPGYPAWVVHLLPLLSILAVALLMVIFGGVLPGVFWKHCVHGWTGKGRGWLDQVSSSAWNIQARLSSIAVLQHVAYLLQLGYSVRQVGKYISEHPSQWITWRWSNFLLDLGDKQGNVKLFESLAKCFRSSFSQQTLRSINGLPSGDDLEVDQIKHCIEVLECCAENEIQEVGWVAGANAVSVGTMFVFLGLSVPALNSICLEVLFGIAIIVAGTVFGMYLGMVQWCGNRVGKCSLCRRKGDEGSVF